MHNHSLWKESIGFGLWTNPLKATAELRYVVLSSLFRANPLSGFTSSHPIGQCPATSVSTTVHIQKLLSIFMSFLKIIPSVSIMSNSSPHSSILSTSPTLRVIYWVMLCYVYCNVLHLSDHQRCLLCEQSTWQYNKFHFWLAYRHTHTHKNTS